MNLIAFWHDSVWSKVIAAGIVAAITAAWTQLRYKWFGWIADIWAIKLTITSQRVSAEPGKGYPLKCWLEMRNDSSKCVAVRLLNYDPAKIPSKSLPPEVLQVRFSNRWVPADPSAEVVAVLPGQLCRLWVGFDDKKFTEAELNAAAGNIGTVIVAANKKHFFFKL